MKVCTTCREAKAAMEFHKRKASPDGLALICRCCSRVKARAYYALHSPRLKRQASEWGKANPERRRAVVAAHYARDLERSRLAGRAKASNRRVICGALDADTLNEVLRSSGGVCVYCGKSARLSVDHVEPVARGGSNERGNLLPSCKPCNSSKGAREVSAWLYEKHGVDGLVRTLDALTGQKVRET